MASERTVQVPIAVPVETNAGQAAGEFDHAAQSLDELEKQANEAREAMMILAKQKALTKSAGKEYAAVNT